MNLNDLPLFGKKLLKFFAGGVKIKVAQKNGFIKKTKNPCITQLISIIILNKVFTKIYLLK